MLYLIYVRTKNTHQVQHLGIDTRRRRWSACNTNEQGIQLWTTIPELDEALSANSSASLPHRDVKMEPKSWVLITCQLLT